MVIDFKPTPKQFFTYQLLNDHETNDILYGGSISSGKSRIACYWLILSCLNFPGTRFLLGRSELKTLKRTTLATFLDIAKEWQIEDQFNFNQVDNVINWNNGSQILL